MGLQDSIQVLAEAQRVVRGVERQIRSLEGKMPAHCNVVQRELDEAVDGINRPLYEATRRMVLLAEELRKEIARAES